MKAIVRTAPGEARLEDIEEPTEDLVRVHATSLNKADWHTVMVTPWLMRFIKVPVVGLDLAGVALSGPFEGQEVIGEVGTGGFGGHAELASIGPERLARKPANVSFEEAACIPTAGLTALQGLRDWGRIQPGARVLVNGASGGVGSFAVQVAKALGASHVTATCSGKNVDFVAGLGADVVWDYTKRDIEGEFDLIFDAAAYRPLREVMPHVADDGVYTLVGGDFGLHIRAMLTARFRYGNRVAWGTAHPTAADLEQLVQWVESGAIRVPLQRTITLADVPEAIVGMGAGRTVGKVAVKIR